MAISLPSQHRRKRLVSLTPMIDVVFLLLIFFMLASRFSSLQEIPLKAEALGGVAAPELAPRLVQVQAQGEGEGQGEAQGQKVLVNGFAVRFEDLEEHMLARLPDREAPLVLQPGEGVALQRLVDVLQVLRGAGYRSIVLAE
ncbi:MAG: biopolymer transporter ExbD [Neomegalonema sp.]|nr:biopolymer transporter ExbD [Neomegalonema sp.]